MSDKAAQILPFRPPLSADRARLRELVDRIEHQQHCLLRQLRALVVYEKTAPAVLPEGLLEKLNDGSGWLSIGKGLIGDAIEQHIKPPEVPGGAA